MREEKRNKSKRIMRRERKGRKDREGTEREEEGLNHLK